MGQLRNLGPASLRMLAAAGISSDDDLRALGSVAAYLAVKRTGANASLNLLWALEGALTGRDWRVVAREDRTALLLHLDEMARRAASSDRARDLAIAATQRAKRAVPEAGATADP